MLQFDGGAAEQVTSFVQGIVGEQEEFAGIGIAFQEGEGSVFGKHELKILVNDWEIVLLAPRRGQRENSIWV